MEMVYTKEEIIRHSLLRRELDKIRFIDLDNTTPSQVLVFLSKMQERLKEIDRQEYLTRINI